MPAIAVSRQPDRLTAALPFDKGGDDLRNSLLHRPAQDVAAPSALAEHQQSRFDHSSYSFRRHLCRIAASYSPLDQDNQQTNYRATSVNPGNGPSLRFLRSEKFRYRQQDQE